MRTLSWSMLVVALAVGWVGQAAGQEPAASLGSPASASRRAGGGSGASTWAALSAMQREALAPLEKDWSQIDEPRRRKWLEIAARYPSMADAERARLHERMTEWVHLSPGERAHARLSFQQAKQLPTRERQARWEAYQALPEEQRRALAERAAAKATERPGTVASGASAPAMPASGARSSRLASVRPVAPAIVQARPGATTTPVNRLSLPASHPVAPGQPRIAVSPAQVDRKTLLPRLGPQHPRAASAPASSTAPPAGTTAATRSAAVDLPASAASAASAP